MFKAAIIDFSTSSLSLLIARVEGHKVETLLHLRNQFSFSASIYEGRILTEVEILEVLDGAVCLMETCKEQQVAKVFAIASSTLQQIQAYDQLMKQVEEKTGLKVVCLGKEEEAEARLIANERYNILPRAVLVDFGSIALKLYSFSNFISTVPIGPLAIYKDNVSEVIPSLKEAENIKHRIREELEKADIPRKEYFENAVLAGVYSWAIWQLYSEYYSLEHEHGEKIIQYKKLKKLCKFLIKDNGRSMMILKNAPELMNQVVPAAILAKELLKRFGVSNIVISDLGVKEGFLKEIIAGKKNAEGLILREN